MGAERGVVSRLAPLATVAALGALLAVVGGRPGEAAVQPPAEGGNLGALHATIDTSIGAGGTLDTPFEPVVDSTGDFLITEQDGDRVVRLDATGEFEDQWGTSGTGPGQLNDPTSIDVAPDDSLFVLDRGAGQGRVQHFEPDGDVVTAITVVAEVPLSSPDDLATTDDGNLLISDTGNGRVVEVEPDGSLVAAWGDTGPGAFRYEPTDVDVGPDGSVYVIDGPVVRRYARDGTLLDEVDEDLSGNRVLLPTVYPPPGGTTDQVPAGLAVDDLGNVFHGLGDNQDTRFVGYTQALDPVGRYGPDARITRLVARDGVLWITRTDGLAGIHGYEVPAARLSVSTDVAFRTHHVDEVAIEARVANIGSEPLTGVTTSSADEPGCDADLGTLAPGQIETVACTHVPDGTGARHGLEVTADSDQIGPVAERPRPYTFLPGPFQTETARWDLDGLMGGNLDVAANGEVWFGDGTVWSRDGTEIDQVAQTGSVSVASTRGVFVGGSPSATLRVFDPTTRVLDPPVDLGPYASGAVDLTEDGEVFVARRRTFVDPNWWGADQVERRSALDGAVIDTYPTPADDLVVDEDRGLLYVALDGALSVYDVGSKAVLDTLEWPEVRAIELDDAGNLLVGAAPAGSATDDEVAFVLTFAPDGDLIGAVETDRVRDIGADPDGSMVVHGTRSLARYAVGPVPDHPFSDVPAWIEQAVSWLAYHEHATGWPDLTFRPDRPLTRAQNANMLWNIAGRPEATTAAAGDCDRLTDVPNWARDAICWLVDAGHANGYPDKTFRPNRTITRVENANMAWNIAGLEPPEGDGCSGLTDVPPWAEDAICRLVEDGHMNGWPDETFRPDRPMTRGQNANVLFNLFG